MYGEDHTFTSLFPALGTTHPEAAYSLIPYEKGFAFLAYLEKTIGEENFALMLKNYLLEFQYKSIDYV